MKRWDWKHPLSKKRCIHFDSSNLFFFFCAYSSAVISIEGFIVKLLLPLCESLTQKYLLLPCHSRISRCILWPLCCSLLFQFLLELSPSRELLLPWWENQKLLFFIFSWLWEITMSYCSLTFLYSHTVVLSEICCGVFLGYYFTKLQASYSLLYFF